MGLTERIKTLAIGQGYTFASIERDLALGQGTIRKWNISSPSCDKLLKVANLLNVSTDYLLTGKEFPNAPNLPSIGPEALEIALEWQKLDYRGKAIIKGDIFKRIEVLESNGTKIV